LSLRLYVAQPTGQVQERHLNKFIPKLVMANRRESPSSINTFKQCKRKYYYQYIEKIPTLSNIHQVRGNIAHSALEDFYTIDISSFTDENYEMKFKAAIQKLCFFQWQHYKKRLDDLQLSKDQERFYFEETMLMLINWVNHFIKDFTKMKTEENLSIEDTFTKIAPLRELEYKSEKQNVRGFIDAIQKIEDEVHIIDYKTNARFDIKDSIRLQLGIYALLYYETHGVTPSKVGIFFLRHKLKMINVDEDLLELARREIELIHAHTGITTNQVDYPQNVTPLCKWRTGQCDFYGVCKPNGK